MFFFSFTLAKETVAVIPQNPCMPSPCGPFANCVINLDGSPSCKCLSSYIGNPPNCHPECIINDDCSYKLACINKKCVDPCPGSCGLNAECHVIKHIPSCTCIDNYLGDPFTICNLKPSKLIFIYVKNM